MRAHQVCFFALGLLLGLTSDLMAHGGPHHEHELNHESVLVTRPHNWNELWRAWEFEPWVILPLAITAFIYSRGLFHVWKRAGVGHGVRRLQAAAFIGGWLMLVVALVSPLHPWGSVLFSVHMSQHELLMLVAAPLLVLGKPIVVFLRGIPATWAAALVRWFRIRGWTSLWHWLVNPFVAWLIHAAVLWIWHLPVLFQATLDNNFVHALQHLSFLLSALLFWWAVLQGPNRAMNFGVATLYMFTTAVHSGILGALLTFSRSLWYPAYGQTIHEWGLTPLEDQQLGGLVMWIPACLVYIAAGLALCAASLRESERRLQRASQVRGVSSAESIQ